ncbi:MAG: PucR family transcriptional regulator ligand-binding domain-containing protein [Thermoanaerobacteraceae bacterium]|nr:PucR family transcriptional regulator ligand-binding domain-containing protein [Thermoanaerobacteraceae bacterium]
MKVKDIFKLREVKGSKLIAGKNGLERNVTCIDVIEVPDVTGWIKEGGFYITAGYAYRDSKEKLRQLISYLIKAKASGLGIKLGRYIDELPWDIIEMANNADFTIINLKTKAPYADIINSVLTKIVHDQSELLNNILRVHEKLTEAVLTDDSTSTFLEKLSHLIDIPVILLDEDLNIVFNKSDKIISNDLNGIVLNHITCPNKDRTGIYEDQYYQSKVYVVTPLSVKGDIRGYLVIISDKNMQLINTMTAEMTATVIAIQYLKQDLIEENNRRIEGNFLYDLLTGNFVDESLVIERAKRLGWDVYRKYFSMVIVTYQRNYNTGPEKKGCNVNERIFKEINEIIEPLGNIKTALFSDYIIAFCSGGLYEKASMISGRIEEIIKQKFSKIEFTIGIGRPVENLLIVSSSYREAMESIKIGERMWGRGKIYLFDDVGVYKILAKLTNDADSKKYVISKLGPLIEYDKKYKSQLIPTFKEFLDSQMNIKKTADKLYIHRNTLIYRIDKIKELLGTELNDDKEIFGYHMALKLMDLSII